MRPRTDAVEAGPSQSSKHATRVRAPEGRARPRSGRSGKAHQNDPGVALTRRAGPAENDRANCPRVEGHRILAEALAALPGALVANLIVLYLVWWGAEMGAQVPRGHALLVGILGCVVVSIAAVVLGLRVARGSSPSECPPGPEPTRPDLNLALRTGSSRGAGEEGADDVGGGESRASGGAKPDQPAGRRSRANNSPGRGGGSGTQRITSQR